MHFDHDEEQEALRDNVRGLLGKAYADFEQRRTAVAVEPGYDEKTWRRLAELGVLGLPFAEEHGGMGAGPVEVAPGGGGTGPGARARSRSWPRSCWPAGLVAAAGIRGTAQRPPGSARRGGVAAGVGA